MSDGSEDRTAIDEIMIEAQKELEDLRTALEKARSASERLDNIGNRIDSGIEKTVELSESSRALNARLETLANAIQELNPESLEAMLDKRTDAIQEAQKETAVEAKGTRADLARLRVLVFVSIGLSGASLVAALLSTFIL